MKIREFFYLSNLLSISRIFLAIPICLIISFDDPRYDLYLILLGVIIIATDYFDGFFSRKLNQVTDIGKLLDPLADKISMAAVLIYLLYYRGFPLTLVILLLYRDIVIFFMGIIITKKQSDLVVSNIWGKWNTAILSMFGLFWVFNIGTYFNTALLILSYSILLISSVSYLRFGEKILFSSRKSRYLFRLPLLAGVIIINLFSSSINFQKSYNIIAAEDVSELHSELLHKYAPTFYLTEGEEFSPVGVESFLRNSELVKGSFPFFINNITISENLSDMDLSEYDKDYFLRSGQSLSDSVSSAYSSIKDSSETKVYGSVKKVVDNGKEYYVLQYWLFFRGSNLCCPDFLWHECDWECVMYMLDDNFTPLKGGYSQNCYGSVNKWKDIEKDEGHPVAYISYGSHSLYFTSGDHTSYIDNRKLIPFGADICESALRISNKEYELEILNSQSWMNFSGYWGLPVTTKLQGPKYLNPENKTLSLWENPYLWFRTFSGK